MTGALRLERVPITHPDALLLVEEVQQEYVVRYGGRDETPLRPGEFDDPEGAFFVGYVEDRPAVSGAWRRRSDVTVFGTANTAEVKRMYVTRAHRGQGLARVMLAHLERTAAAAGAEVMVLETGTAQPEAITLYVSAGYVSIPSFGHYKDSPENRCFAHSLSPPGRPRTPTAD